MQENVVGLLHTRKGKKMEHLTKLHEKLYELKDMANRMAIGTTISASYKAWTVELIEGCLDDLLHLGLEEYDEPEPGCEVMKDAGPLDFTIDLMRSADYKERFEAEYYQTKIRYGKLHKMLIKAEAGTLDFKPTCPLELLKEQKQYMGMYLHALEVRAEIEGIEL